VALGVPWAVFGSAWGSFWGDLGGLRVSFGSLSGSLEAFGVSLGVRVDSWALR
jgi:hypothetical protein